MTYDERLNSGHEDYVKTLRDDELLEGTIRAKDWEDVIRWVEEWDREAKQGKEVMVDKIEEEV